MKKLIIPLFFLLTLPLVYAQPRLNLFGQSYPITLAAPVILIGLLILFFLIVFLKNNLLKLFKFKIKIKKTEKEKKEKIELKPAIYYLNQVRKVERNLDTLSTDQAFKQIDNVIKDFFSETYNLHYEFTYSELENELIKRKVDIRDFIEKVSKLKYSGAEATKADVKKVTDQLIYIIKKYHPVTEKEKPSLIKGFLDTAKKLNIIHNLKMKGHKRKITKKQNAILKLIANGQAIMHKDIPLAIRNYLRALLLYYQLPKRKEKEIHINLEKFREELKKTGKHKKEVDDFSKKLLAVKHKGKQVSVEGINLLNRFMDFIRTEEILLSKKLERTAEGLEKEEREFKENIIKSIKGLPRKMEGEKEVIKSVKLPKLIEKPVKLPLQKESKLKSIEIKPPTPIRLKYRLLKIRPPEIPKEKLSRSLVHLRHEKNQIYKKLKDLERFT